MYSLLKATAYNQMSSEEKILEVRKWVDNTFAYCRYQLRNLACIPDDDPDILTVIKSPYKDLPKLINEYDQNSVQHMILKHRLENKIVHCTMNVLDINAIRIYTLNELRDVDGEDALTDEMICSQLDYLRDICKILGFQDLLEDIILWRP